MPIEPGKSSGPDLTKTDDPNIRYAFYLASAISFVRALFLAGEAGYGATVIGLLAFALICALIPRIDSFDFINAWGVKLKIREVGNGYITQLSELRDQSLRAQERVARFIRAFAESLLNRSDTPSTKEASDAIELLRMSGYSDQEIRGITQPWVDRHTVRFLDREFPNMQMVHHSIEFTRNILDSTSGAPITPGSAAAQQGVRAVTPEFRQRMLALVEAAKQVSLSWAAAKDRGAEPLVQWVHDNREQVAALLVDIHNIPGNLHLYTPIVASFPERFALVRRFRDTHDPADLAALLSKF